MVPRESDAMLDLDEYTRLLPYSFIRKVQRAFERLLRG